MRETTKRAEPSLREEWKRLSPRERDARVAEALGESFKPDTEALTYAEWLKPYSTSWEHAGQLLEKLRSEGACVDLFGACDLDRDSEEETWIATVTWGLDSDLKNEQACGSSAPEAIALAFLLAKGGAQ